MVDLVSSRTELRKAGANRFTGLCPFHDERSPSFGINPAEKVYYCFGCQASGDAFTFVMETEGVDFKGAHRAARRPLQGRAGARGRGSARGRAARAPRAPARAARAHGDVLRAPAVGVARSRARAGLSGAARPRGGDAARVSRRLRAERVGHGAQRVDARRASRRRELWDAGLLQSNEKSGRKYDRFRSQIIFPLADSRGRVRGFAGRSLVPDDERRGPKYVNSPESPPASTSSTSAASSSPPTSRARRRRRPAASSSPRATRTSSRCIRSACATASASWARR